jgi:hypothetical protein
MLEMELSTEGAQSAQNTLAQNLQWCLVRTGLKNTALQPLQLLQFSFSSHKGP